MAKTKYSDYTKEQLIEKLNKLEKKKYGLVWDDKYKSEMVADRCAKELPVLIEDKSKEIITKFKQPTHFIFEGDNYHALYILNFTHQKKIDVIYIDPPYNTGEKDFKFNDKFIDEEDKFRHSKWLSFMSKRLWLSKKLLKQDGVIFISIDGNEYTNLKILCDKIFNERNLLSVHHIQVRYGNKSLNEKKDFQELIEYVLIYAKDKSYFKANKFSDDYNLEKFNLDINEINLPDKTLEISGRRVDIFLKGSYSIQKKIKGSVNLFKETWISGSIYSKTGHGQMYQKVVENRLDEDGLSTLYKIHGLGEDGLGFRYMINPQRKSAIRGKMFTKVPENKKESIENKDYKRSKPIINYYDFSADFGNIRHEGGISFNSGKKPVKMLKQFINYHKNKDAVVLDFFSGSGSTGHAVLELNKDGGNRQFIMCTNNEVGLKKEKEFCEKYHITTKDLGIWKDENKQEWLEWCEKYGICSTVTYPRIKNVINGYTKTDCIPANVKYFKTDFVPAVLTDNDKRNLVERSTELICIAENTFNVVRQESKLDYAIFSKPDQHTAIIYDEDYIEECCDKLNKIQPEHKTVIYVFSYDHTYNSEDFKSLNIAFIVKPIPEAIINVYRKISKLKNK